MGPAPYLAPSAKMPESDKSMGQCPVAPASLTPSLASRTLPSQQKTTSSTTGHPNENISIIENDGTGDSWQIMVSTNDKAIHGTNKGRGWRTRQTWSALVCKTPRTTRKIPKTKHNQMTSTLGLETGMGQGTPCRMSLRRW